MRNQRASFSGLLTILMQVQMSSERTSEMVYGQIQDGTTQFLTWMMKKRMQEDEKILMKSGMRKKEKMRKWGREEKRVEEMTNGRLMDSNLLVLIFSSSVVLSHAVLEISLLSFTPRFSTYLGEGNTLSTIHREEKLYFVLCQIHSYPFPSRPKLHRNNTTVLCGGPKPKPNQTKKTLLLPQFCWKLESAWSPCGGTQNSSFSPFPQH